MENIKKNKFISTFSIVFLLIISVLIKLSTFYPLWIEKNYSRGIYPYISCFYRTIFGWLPLSFGDLLYTIAVFFLLRWFIKFIKFLTKFRSQPFNVTSKIKKAFFILATIYVYFNLAWGLNYNRPGIAYQLKLDPKVYNVHDLKLITGILLQKVNNSKKWIVTGEHKYKTYPQVFAQAQAAYNTESFAFPFLEYKTKSVKRSLYGKMGNMLGFLGYYNPFTGEAQLNLTMPRFLIPYVTCHEMAHQLGYASESEANFVGYLAAVNSKDTLFHYSAYFDLFQYANRELSIQDSIASKNNIAQLDPSVKKDIAELREYWRKSDNVIEPFIKVFYDNYLKANQQQKGIKSYNEVIGWLIAYYKKYGSI